MAQQPIHLRPGLDTGRSDLIDTRSAGTLISGHAFPRNHQERRIVYEVEQIIETAARVPGRPQVQFGLHPPYRDTSRIQIRPGRGTGIHRRVFGHYFPSLTDTLPPFPMHAAFPRPEYYDGSAPPAPSAGVAPIPAPAPPAEGGAWNEHGWFPRSLLSGQRARHPALPLRHRHGYAAVLHRGLQARTGETQPGVPRHGLAGTHRDPARIHRVRAGRASRGVTTPVPRVYLPVLLTAPAPSGSPGTTRLCRGCSRLPRRPADQAASSFTPPLRRQGDKGLPPPSGTTAPRGAPPAVQHPSPSPYGAPGQRGRVSGELAGRRP